MGVNFSNQEYFKKAMELAGRRPVTSHTPEQAFLVLIHGASRLQLENLCNRMVDYSKGTYDFEQCYEMTQNQAELISAGEILSLAYQCLKSGKQLGNEIAGGRFNTSAYFGHSLWEGKLCGDLAAACGLDPNRAQIYGILHDYGRCVSHRFDHTIRGFELLVDAGWEDEALACLTHSYLSGGRCANCEVAEPGFYVDEDGNPCWQEDAVKDEMTVFLEKYSFTDYDEILNMGDLMATSNGIVSPKERLADILSRRVLDPANYGFFLAEFTNLLNRFRIRISKSNEKPMFVRASEHNSIEQLQKTFEQASDTWMMALSEKI